MTPEEGQARLAARLQFPRRVVVLLIAFGIAWAFVILLRGTLAGNPPVREGGNAGILIERLGVSLLLAGLTLVLTLIQTAVVTVIAVGVHTLEARSGVPGSILKGLGRLWVYGQAAMPAFALAALGILIFGVQLRVLPPVWGTAAERAGLLGRLPFLILPTFCLALLPTVLTAQVITREVTLPREQGGGRAWLGGTLLGLGALAGQTAGLLSSLVVVEAVFAIPGIGRLFLDAFQRLDLGLAANLLVAYAALVLLGRLLAELLRWLARQLGAPPPPALPEPTAWRKTARRLWVVLSLALLLLPLLLGLAGLTVSSDAVQGVDPAARAEGPSGEHWLGTDQLGRDTWARVLRGGTVTLGKSVLAALVLTIFGGLGGALTGWLANRRTFPFESVADLVGLPGYALLLLPAVPMAAVLGIAVARGGSAWGVALAAAVVLLPRAAGYFHTLWVALPNPLADRKQLLAGVGSLALGSLFAAIWLISAVDFLGFGTRPPVPTLGAMLQEGMQTLLATPWGAAAPALALWIPAFAFFTATNALLGHFPTKEPLARLNE